MVFYNCLLLSHSTLYKDVLKKGECHFINYTGLLLYVHSSPDSGLYSGKESTIQSPAFKKITIESPSVLRYVCVYLHVCVYMYVCVYVCVCVY